MNDCVQLKADNDALRAALREQGFFVQSVSGRMVWHAHGCNGAFDFAECSDRCRIARDLVATGEPEMDEATEAEIRAEAGRAMAAAEAYDYARATGDAS